MRWWPFTRTSRRDEHDLDDLPDIEVWNHLSRAHRHQRRLTWTVIALAYVALAIAAYVHAAALAQPLVYYVGPDGAATFGGRLDDQGVPRDVEVRYIARRFVQLTLGVSSASVERDFAEAYNLMTQELQQTHNRELAAYQAERGVSFLQHVRARAIRASVDVQRIEVTQGKGAWVVRVLGRVRTWPLNAVAEDAAFVEQEFEVGLTIVPVDRTELTPNGLLVAQRSQRLYAPQSDAALAEETVPGGPR